MINDNAHLQQLTDLSELQAIPREEEAKQDEPKDKKRSSRQQIADGQIQEEEEQDIMKHDEEEDAKAQNAPSNIEEQEQQEMKILRDSSDDDQIKDKKSPAAAKQSDAQKAAEKRISSSAGYDLEDMIEQIIRAEQLGEKSSSKDKKKKKDKLPSKKQQKKSTGKTSKEKRQLHDVLHLLELNDSENSEDVDLSASDKEDAAHERQEHLARKAGYKTRSSRKAQERTQRDIISQELRRMMGEQAHIGSVAYGLPVLAVTRRTLDVQIKAKQIEIVNDKIMRIMRRPQDYVDDVDSD